MSDDFPIYIPRKKRPSPGSLPMSDREVSGPPNPTQFAVPPFIPDDELEARPPPRSRTPRRNIDKLKAINRERDNLRAAVRDDAFDEWVRRYLMEATKPAEWTQSSLLYACYIRRARDYGRNKTDRALVKLEFASETRFGILMRDAGFSKSRRAKGYFYPVRLKQGA